MKLGQTAWNKGVSPSDETRAKLSKANMGQIAWNRGISPSSETLAKLSVALKGKPAWNKGIPMTDERKAWLSAVNMGRRAPNKGVSPSPETRAKMSVAQKEMQNRPEVKENNRLKHIGRAPTGPEHHTVETRAKMSISAGSGPLSRYWKGGPRISNAKHRAKRRTFGFNPLNSYFVGADAHHINQNDVIYIPKAMHVSIRHNQYTGQGMAEMNALAGQFLTEDWT